MSTQRVLALVALILAVLSFVVHGYPLMQIAVVLLALAAAVAWS
jgi:hypothetical protein